MAQFHPEDRPDPSEQPIRARVPEHVTAGAFSTGVIVMTAQSEFILDFVQNLGRPHQIIARVVMPHQVLPQFVDALQRNIELYKNRWGELPQTGMPKPAPPSTASGSMAASRKDSGYESGTGQDSGVQESMAAKSADGTAALAGGGSSGGSGVSGGGGSSSGSGSHAEQPPSQSNPPQSNSNQSNSASGQPSGSVGRQASVQDIYDDLKIRDEFLSGAYANAVMIGHGPHEFSFDFITNFYPHSAVSSRVFLAAGQIPRLYESLKGTWEQLRSRMQQPPSPPTDWTPEPDNPPQDDSPF